MSSVCVSASLFLDDKFKILVKFSFSFLWLFDISVICSLIKLGDVDRTKLKLLVEIFET